MEMQRGAFYYYFKNSKIFSGDICPDLFRYKSSRLKNFYINTSSMSSIDEILIKNKDNFNIIIEDASHTLKDQIISLFKIKLSIFFLERYCQMEFLFVRNLISQRQGKI